MNRRLLPVLIILFVALLVLNLAQNVGVFRIEPTPQIVFLRLFPQIGSPADVGALRLQDPNSAAAFTIRQTENGDWQADEGTLDEDAGVQMAATIALLAYRRTLPLNAGDDLTQYGFEANGQLLIQIALSNGEAHVVAIGGLTPSGATYYALVDNREEIYLLERAPVDFLIVQLRTPPVA